MFDTVNPDTIKIIESVISMNLRDGAKSDSPLLDGNVAMLSIQYLGGF